MFFIVPSPVSDSSPSVSGPSASGEHSLSAVGDVDAYYRRRVAAAYVNSIEQREKALVTHQHTVVIDAG